MKDGFMKCPFCEEKIPETADYCTHCKSPITAKAEIEMLEKNDESVEKEKKDEGSFLWVLIIIGFILFVIFSDSSSNSSIENSTKIPTTHNETKINEEEKIIDADKEKQERLESLRKKLAEIKKAQEEKAALKNACPKDECSFNDTCISKPSYSYCVENDPNNAWTCFYGYRDNGYSCDYIGYSIFEKKNYIFNGEGEWTIKNKASENSIIKIIKKDHGKVIDFFLPAGEDFILKNISDGVYSFYSCSSAKNNVALGEMKNLSCSKFDDYFVFETHRLSRSIEYTTMEITLYNVVGGTATSSKIPLSEFEIL